MALTQVLAFGVQRGCNHLHVDLDTSDGSITASVGVGGANRRDDVLTVQKLLNQVTPDQGGPVPLLEEDGWIGPLTTGAIRAFQKRQFGWSDGRVDPGQVTITRLNELTGSPFAGADVATAGATGATVPGAKTPSQLAVEIVPEARLWIQAAIRRLDLARAILTGPDNLLGSPDNLLVPVETHFHLISAPQPVAKIDQVRMFYGRMLAVLNETWQFFDNDKTGSTDTYAYTIAGGYLKQGKISPIRIDGKAVKLRNDTIFFSQPYTRLGAMARTNVLIHEMAHFVGTDLDITHVAYDTPAPNGEPYKGRPLNYAQLKAFEAIRNVYSYTAFGCHCRFSEDVRFSPYADESL